MHGEASSEKTAIGHYLDGLVSAVVGTHTHVPTCDHRILPKGTAYCTDLGMTGPYDSIIGVEKDAVIHRFLTGMPSRFETAKGDPRFAAAVVDVDEQTGRARSIDRMLLTEDDIAPALSPAILSPCRPARGDEAPARGPRARPRRPAHRALRRRPRPRVVAWNRGREQGPIGRPRGRAVGRPLKAVLGAAGFRATEPVLREVLRTGRPHEETWRRTGGLFHVRRLPVRRGRR